MYHIFYYGYQFNCLLIKYFLPNQVLLSMCTVGGIHSPLIEYKGGGPIILEPSQQPAIKTENVSGFFWKQNSWLETASVLLDQTWLDQAKTDCTKIRQFCLINPGLIKPKLIENWLVE